MDLVRRIALPFTDQVVARTMGPRDREFLTTTAVMTFLLGLFLAFDPSSKRELFFGWLWPWWWMATGVVIVSYAIRPWSTFLHALSSATLITACVARAITVAIAIVLGEVPADRMWRSAGGVIFWLLMGRLVRRQWRTLMPLPRDRAVAAR